MNLSCDSMIETQAVQLAASREHHEEVLTQYLVTFPFSHFDHIFKFQHVCGILTPSLSVCNR